MIEKGIEIVLRPKVIVATMDSRNKGSEGERCNVMEERKLQPQFFSLGPKNLTRLGLEPRTSSVLRKRDNQLHHPAVDFPAMPVVVIRTI